MPGIDELFTNNRSWAGKVRRADPDFFSRLSKQQAPRYLWIGCADSRVPANEIVGLSPGELFVHRNVANVVVHTDLNCLSVLQYAVDVLRVEHVIVCGHDGCGGVQAALQGAPLGLIDVQDGAAKHREALHAVADEGERVNRLCELNVLEQVVNVCRTTIVQDAWRRGQKIAVHAVIYGLHDGLLRDLGRRIASADDLESALHAVASRAPRPT
jgi:carbonic anhydrase